jgi:hypothetical protein
MEPIVDIPEETEDVRAEKERRVLKLWWGKGRDRLITLEAQLIELATTGEPLKLTVCNAYNRMVIYQVGTVTGVIKMVQ